MTRNRRWIHWYIHEIGCCSILQEELMKCLRLHKTGRKSLPPKSSFCSFWTRGFKLLPSTELAVSVSSSVLPDSGSVPGKPPRHSFPHPPHPNSCAHWQPGKVFTLLFLSFLVILTCSSQGDNPCQEGPCQSPLCAQRWAMPDIKKGLNKYFLNERMNVQSLIHLWHPIWDPLKSNCLKKWTVCVRGWMQWCLRWS